MSMLDQDSFPVLSQWLRHRATICRKNAEWAEIDRAQQEIERLERVLARAGTGMLEPAQNEESLEREEELNRFEQELRASLQLSQHRLELIRQLSEVIRNQTSQSDRLQQELQSFRREWAQSERTLKDEIARLQIETQDFHRNAREQLCQIERLQLERHELSNTLSMVLTSRGWKLAEKCRAPLRLIRRFTNKLQSSAASDGDREAAALPLLPATSQTSASPASPPQAAQDPIRNGKPFESAATPAPTIAVRAALECGRSANDHYQRWIDEQEPGTEELRQQSFIAERFDYKPAFSIVVPIYQPPPAILRACIESVRAQTYGNWQLCASIVPSSDWENAHYLRAVAAEDPRLQLIELPSNQGISGNSNAALSLATGDFVAFLDHDDTLAPFALFELASHLQSNPEADVLFSDHDYLGGIDDLRCDPLFKPDWSPEIMLSANYITHLTVLRQSLVSKIGKFDSLTDGAQDWDFYLRATDLTDRIHHIPKILYHWRKHAQSTAFQNSAKPYAEKAQLMAIARHMQRNGIPGLPEVLPNGLLHVRPGELPNKLVSIIIPTKDRLDLISRCMSTLLTRTTYENFEVILVDNDSRDPATRDYLRGLRQDNRITVLWEPGGFNYSRVNNRAVAFARGELLLFLNNDVEIIDPEWLHELVFWASQPQLGVVGSRLLRSDGSIQHAGVVVGMNGFADHPFADNPRFTYGMAGSSSWYRNWLAVTGACMMIRREVFDLADGFDERLTLCGNDVDLCLRIREKGYRILCNPFSELIHHECQTRGGDVPQCDYYQSYESYKTWLTIGDPYWNPNLSLWNRTPAFRYRSEQASLDFVQEHIASLQPESPVDVHPALAQTDAHILVSCFDCSDERFRWLREQAELTKGLQPVRRVLWFIPKFEYGFYGGIYTILRFAEYWKREYNVQNLFAVCGGTDSAEMANRIRTVHPYVLESEVFVLPGMDDTKSLPAADAVICTLWTTAYYAARYEHTARRFYMIQDYEPAFYAAGSISALVESTYRMGLYGIANTIGLQKMYEHDYNGSAVSFKPCINDSVFFAPERRAINRRGPWQVFCYGRPHHPRNAFELLIAAMKKLKERLGSRVRIVSAGDNWDPAHFGLRGIIENLGVVDYADTGRLYRESDAGVVFMLTRHPSYIPLELMACGCLTVTNRNAWTEWLLSDGENCLFAPSTPTAIADTVERGLLDADLRERIRKNGIELVRSQHLDWASEMAKVYDYMCNPEQPVTMANRMSFKAFA